jgi:hypothetical protein
MKGNRTPLSSARFRPNGMVRILVPVLIGALFLILVAALAVTILSLTGLTPGA